MIFDPFLRSWVGLYSWQVNANARRVCFLYDVRVITFTKTNLIAVNRQDMILPVAEIAFSRGRNPQNVKILRHFGKSAKNI
jgi:hypothetical protein